MSKFSELLVAALAGPIEMIGKEKFKELLLKIKPEESQKLVITTLYSVFDAEIEKLSDASKTKIDDAIVGAIKSALEEVADDLGIELQNLDQD